MTSAKRFVGAALIGGLVAGGALALGATTASADVACNRYGECWHVRDHYTTYPHHLRVVFHDDAWRARHMHRYHWRADRDDDHGYYYHGHWRPF